MAYIKVIIINLIIIIGKFFKYSKWIKGTIPKCNEITLELPKGSGKNWTFPEIDQAVMMTEREAKIKLCPEQCSFIDR